MAVEKTSDVTQLQQQLTEARAEVERLNLRVREETRVLNHLIDISNQLNSTLNLPELLRLIMNNAKEMFNAEACSIMLLDEDTGELVFEVALGEKQEEVGKHRIPPGQGIAGQVAQSGRPLMINSVKDHPQFYGGIDQAVGFETRNMLAVPLKVKERVVGVVEIINTRGRSSFEDRDLTLATTLASQAAIAIDNSRMYQKLSEALVMSRMSYRL